MRVKGVSKDKAQTERSPSTYSPVCGLSQQYSEPHPTRATPRPCGRCEVHRHSTLCWAVRVPCVCSVSVTVLILKKCYCSRAGEGWCDVAPCRMAQRSWPQARNAVPLERSKRHQNISRALLRPTLVARKHRTRCHLSLIHISEPTRPY